MYQHSSCTCVAKQQPTQNQTKTKPQKPKTVKHQNPSKLPCYLQYPGSTNRIQIQRRWERCSKGNHKFHKESSLTQFGPFTNTPTKVASAVMLTYLKFYFFFCSCFNTAVKQNWRRTKVVLTQHPLPFHTQNQNMQANISVLKFCNVSFYQHQ